MAHYVHTCALGSTLYVLHIKTEYFAGELNCQINSHHVNHVHVELRCNSGDEIAQGPEGASLFHLFRCHPTELSAWDLSVLNNYNIGM